MSKPSWLNRAARFLQRQLEVTVIDHREKEARHILIEHVMHIFRPDSLLQSTLPPPDSRSGVRRSRRI